jgi:hypothetical protein
MFAKLAADNAAVVLLGTFGSVKKSWRKWQAQRRWI